MKRGCRLERVRKRKNSGQGRAPEIFPAKTGARGADYAVRGGREEAGDAGGEIAEGDVNRRA